MKILNKIFQIFVGIIILGFVYLLFQYFMKWDAITIDKHISKNSAYRKIDNQKISHFLTMNKEDKYTNNVIFSFDDRTTEIQDFNYHHCNIYFEGPFLIIQFISGDGFSGGGYNLRLLKGRFNTEPYFYTDNPSTFDNNEYSKVHLQHLVLNKENYKSGDSIFGKINLKIQKDYGPEKSFEYGNGYFRGLIP